MSEVVQAMDELKGVIHEYKKVNDERIEKLEKNEGKAELDAKLAKMDGDIDAALELKKEHEDAAKRLENIEIAVKRFGGADIAGSDKAEAKAHADAFQSAVKKMAKANTLNPHQVNLDEAEHKSLTSQIDPDGGYTVTPFIGGFEKILFDTSPVRNLASVISIGTNAYEFFYDDDEMAASWVGETDARASTGTAQIGKGAIQVNEMYANVPVTEQLLEDSNINIMSWAGEKVAEKMARLEATGFVTGNGITQPVGFTTATNKTSNADVYTRDQIGTVTTAGATAITGSELIDLRSKLKPGYRGNAYFSYNRATEAYIRKLTDGQGNYLWQPNYQAGEPDQLLGQRTVIMEDMADIAGSALTVVLADFRTTYQIVDRVGMSMLDDPYTNKAYRQLYFRRRVGGGIKNFDAMKYLVQKA